MKPSQKTKDAITKVWNELRPSCKNDRSAIKKVTRYLNKTRLAGRALKENTVTNYTLQFGLREKFVNRLRQVVTKVESSPNGIPSIEELEYVLETLKEMESWTPLSRHLVLNSLKMKGEHNE